MFTATAEVEVQVRSLADAESMVRGIARQNDLNLLECDRVPSGLRITLSGGLGIGADSERFRSAASVAFTAIQRALASSSGVEPEQADATLENRLPQMLEYEVKEQPWRPTQEPRIEVVPHGTLGDLRSQADILILTATEIELDAALTLMSPLPGREALLKVNIEKATYYLGVMGAAPAVLALSEMGSGGRDGSLTSTNRALRVWAPRAAVMMGIAFGLKPNKQQLGDVLVSERLSPYEPQRVGSVLVHRGVKTQAGKTLLSRFRMAKGWAFKRPDNSVAKEIVGEVVSGEKLVDNKEFRDQLARTFPEAIGGEMEGAGFQAAADDFGVEWIIVKGICDWGMGKQATHQPMAAAAAGSLVKHVFSDVTALEGLQRCVGQSERGAGLTVRVSSDLVRVSRLPIDLQRERDIRVLQRLLKSLPIRFVSHCLDQAAVDRMLHEVFYFWEGFNAEANALDFFLFDEEARKAVHEFHRAWGRCLSHGAEFLPSLNPGVYRYRDRLPGEPHSEFLKAHDEYVSDVYGAEQSLSRLVEVLLARFEELDLYETSRGAIEAHEKWMGRMDDKLGLRGKAAKLAKKGRGRVRSGTSRRRVRVLRTKPARSRP